MKVRAICFRHALVGSGRAPVRRARRDRNRPTARRSDGASAAAQISYLKATDLRALHDEVNRLLELADADRQEDDALDLDSDPASDRIRPLAELAVLRERRTMGAVRGIRLAS